MDVLDLLVTSRARKALLRAVVGQEASGSVSDLARRSGVRPSTAERELARMARFGLVSFEKSGNEKRVCPNLRSKDARALKGLLAATSGRRAPAARAEWRVRAELAHYGAPLFVPGNVERRPVRPLEVTLASALRLAHSDPVVAGNLPVVLWRHRADLDLAELQRLASRHGEAQALGFFLELTDQLGGETFFRPRAQALLDKRVRRMRNFFSADGSLGECERDLALLNTPEVARRWHFVMNMPLESFASYFRKGAEPRVRLSP